MSTISSSSRPPASHHSRRVRLLHTSDIHIGRDKGLQFDTGWSERPIEDLRCIVRMARASDVDSILISGDFFDHNRIPQKLAAITSAILAQSSIPVVILPGNHDPYTVDSVYRRNQFPDNVHILNEAAGQLLELPLLGIQVWGQAHVDYLDCAPLGVQPLWRDIPGSPLWRVALAHGLFVRSEYETRLSYRIYAHELEQLGAHYIGLGHLEHHEKIGECAYYAGAPERSGGATVIDLAPSGVTVRNVPFSTPP